jgi:hypothetical protein
VRKEEEEHLKAIEQAEGELRVRDQKRQQAEVKAKTLAREASSDDADSKSLAPYDGPEESPWLVLDLDHKSPQVAVPEQSELTRNEATADLDLFEPRDSAGAPAAQGPNGSERGLELLDDEPSFPAHLAEQLSSKNSAERAAALADLAHRGGEESFRLITKSFEDPAAEVRNATARALYDLSSDRAASFTRALREASPDRRRKIGSAMAGSGLARDAINALSGESREKTHDAFSILFLMAKAGEVQPLTQAIKEHSDLEVRLAVVKLLALSSQPQSLPALRSLAVRGSLPPDVHTAVMAAIYSLSPEVRENAHAVL